MKTRMIMLCLFLLCLPCQAVMRAWVEGELLTPLLVGVTLHHKADGDRTHKVEFVVSDGKNMPILRRYVVRTKPGNTYFILGTAVDQSGADPFPALKGRVGWAVRTSREAVNCLAGPLKELFAKALPQFWDPKYACPCAYLTTQALPRKLVKCRECLGLGKVTGKKGNGIKSDKWDKEPCQPCGASGNKSVLDWTAMVEQCRQAKLAQDAKKKLTSAEAAAAAKALAEGLAPATELVPTKPTKENEAAWSGFLKELQESLGKK